MYAARLAVVGFLMDGRKMDWKLKLQHQTRLGDGREPCGERRRGRSLQAVVQKVSRPCLTSQGVSPGIPFCIFLQLLPLSMITLYTSINIWI